MSDSISLALARRIALAAQGFGRPQPAEVGTRQLNSTIHRLGLLQLDSVNVFERSHYLPLYARLGAYDRALLDRLVFSPRGRYIEYWAHEAALIPVETWPLLRFRMEFYRERFARRSADWLAANDHLVRWLLDELAAKGPLAASAVDHDANVRSGPWWGWSDVKTGLEIMFRRGDLVSGGRRRFERVYALPEQILPSDIIDRRVDRADAHRELVAQSARAIGIGTASDLADYFRLRNDDTVAAIRDLEDAGELRPVTVPGWNRKAWVHRDARMPRRIDTVAMLSPFDPVVWERDRAERMFGFRYRIEIYTPAPKRLFGYYSLPILVDEHVVGRIDLKSDRQNGVLRVQSAWTEEQAPADVAERLVPLLRATASWQGLEGVEVRDWGDLAPGVAAELGVPLLPRVEPQT